MFKVGARKLHFIFGFSLLELLVVIVAVALLIAVNYKHVNPSFENASAKAVNFQASTFKRAILTIHATASLSTGNTIIMKGMSPNLVYVNEFGWPTNTSSASSASAFNQTPEECRELWHFIFKNTHSSAIYSKESNLENGYQISSINGQICRYEFVGTDVGPNFFDYYLGTGEVMVSTSQQ